MKTFILSLVIIFILFSETVQSQWVSSYGGFVAAEALATSGNTIVTATHNNGMYATTDAGANWVAASTGLPVASITYKLAYHGGDVIAVADGNWGMYRSTNNGTSWTQSGFTGIWLTSIFIDGSNLFVGTNGNGVYLSTDNGTNWTQVNSGFGTQIGIWTFAKIGNNLFAGGGSSMGNGVFMTTDNGANWTRPANNGINAQSMVTLSAIGNNLFAGTFSNGMLLSTDNGENWTAINSGLTNMAIRSAIVVGNNLFVGTNGGGVYLTTDNGTSWTTQNTGLGYLFVYALSICDSKLFAGGIGVWSRPLSDMITSVEEIKGTNLPAEFSLQQNYPNPFNPTTNIGFQITNYGFVSLKIFDVLGKEIATLVNENLSAGKFSVDWNAENVSSGLYFYKLSTEKYSETKRMILMK